MRSPRSRSCVVSARGGGRRVSPGVEGDEVRAPRIARAAELPGLPPTGRTDCTRGARGRLAEAQMQADCRSRRARRRDARQLVELLAACRRAWYGERTPQSG